ncbi:MAG TPA: cation:proton antiporter, partial [Solirubrobacterales bacterium]|nr:cation:proton antiporter [Solirubrobacterales bacterium]
LAVVARRLGQPLILGYVVGGAVLGPHIGFGVVTDEKVIEEISEIGLIFLLFIIGLEISVPRLLRAGRTIVVSGLLQFPICVGLAWLTLGGLLGGGGRFDRLYLAVALALSSTLIVVKLLSDKFEMGSFAGRVTLGILVFQDLWAIVFLALQPNLTNLQPGPLLRSGLAGLALVAGAAALARWVLPGLFRWMATSPELLLVTSVGWCFLLSGAAGLAGLSYEMGALVAGMVIAAFPYGTEVIARLSGVRDFFVTLFFVSLGLKIPEPSLWLVALAAAAAAFVVASRFLAVFPLFALLRLDNRTAGVVSINLAQVSEFSLVICSIGLQLGHVSESVVSLVLYTLLATAVLSTYGILFSHPLATLFARLIGGAKFLGDRGAAPAAAAGAEAGPEDRDLFFLGVSREGVAFLEHLERESPAMKQRIVAVDFNPEIVERLQREGVHCHYGDISNVETLRHAGIEHASIVISGISDWFLKGTDNSRLLRQARAVAPGARVLVTADNLDRAARLYAEGADYVLIPPVLAAEHLYELLRDTSPEGLADARQRQAAELFARPVGPAAQGT